MYSSKYNLVFPINDVENVILNPLSGAIDLFDNTAIILLNHSNRADVAERYSNFLDYCKNRGYAYHEPSQEKEKLLRFENLFNEALRQQPLQFTLYVTHMCNLRCSYCFQGHSEHNDNTLVSTNVINAMFKTIVTFKEKMNNFRPPVVSLFGGEPLLKSGKHWSTIEEILKLCREYDCQIEIVTNGVNLEYYVPLLSKYVIKEIMVTLDGPRHIHDMRRVFADGSGTFDKIVAGIDSALRKKIPIMLRVNVDNENIESLPELADFILAKEWLNYGLCVTIGFVNDAGQTCCENEDNSPLENKSPNGKPVGPEHMCNAESVKLDSLKKFLEIKSKNEKMDFMLSNSRFISFFEYLAKNGKLPLPITKFCHTNRGNQFSLSLLGNFFTCCCMNGCSLNEYETGRFYPTLQLNEIILEDFISRDITKLSLCSQCSIALLCGGGCTRLVLQNGKRLKCDNVCPPMANMDYIQVLADYYMPKIIEKFNLQKNGAIRSVEI